MLSLKIPSRKILSLSPSKHWISRAPLRGIAAGTTQGAPALVSVFLVSACFDGIRRSVASYAPALAAIPCNRSAETVKNTATLAFPLFVNHTHTHTLTDDMFTMITPEGAEIMLLLPALHCLCPMRKTLKTNRIPCFGRPIAARSGGRAALFGVVLRPGEPAVGDPAPATRQIDRTKPFTSRTAYRSLFEQISASCSSQTEAIWLTGQAKLKSATSPRDETFFGRRSTCTASMRILNCQGGLVTDQ